MNKDKIYDAIIELANVRWDVGVFTLKLERPLDVELIKIVNRIDDVITTIEAEVWEHKQ